MNLFLLIYIITEISYLDIVSNIAHIMPDSLTDQIYDLLDPSIPASGERLSSLKELLSANPELIKATRSVQIDPSDILSTVLVTPLIFVMRNSCNIDLINILCDHGADVCEPESYDDPTAQKHTFYRDPRGKRYHHFIERNRAVKHIKLFHTLPYSDCGQVMHEFLPLLTSTLYSPLHYALVSGNTDLFFSLWERHKKAYLKKILKSKGHKIPLLPVDTAVSLTRLAVLMGAVEVTKLFIEKGQFVKADRIEELVEAAIAHDQLDTLKLLTSDDITFKVQEKTLGEVATAITGHVTGKAHIPYHESTCLQYLVTEKFKTDGYMATLTWLGKINFELSEALVGMYEDNQRLQKAIASYSKHNVQAVFKKISPELAIHLVIVTNNLEHLKYLESCGASLASNKALHYALAGYSNEILMYCLSKNDDFKSGNISTVGALQYAIQMDNSKFIQAVIDNPKISKKQLKQLAKLAVELNALDVFKTLCISGLVQDDEGELAFIALKNKHEEVLEELLTKVEHSEQYFYTLMLSAIEHKDLLLVQAILPKVPNSLTPDRELTPLQVAVEHFNLEIFDLILTQTEDVNSFTTSNSPLILALTQKDPLYMVQALLKRGANPNQIERLSKKNQTSLPFCKKKFMQLQKLKLHSRGTIFNKKVVNTNAFLFAIATMPSVYICFSEEEYEKRTAIFNLMLKYGADLSMVDGKENNPLIILLAAMNHQFDSSKKNLPCLYLLPWFLKHNRHLLFKPNLDSVTALSLGKALDEKHLKSLLITSFSLLIEQCSNVHDYPEIDAVYEFMRKIEDDMGWDDLRTEVTSFAFCILSKNPQLVEQIARLGIDFSSLMIKKTLSSHRKQVLEASEFIKTAFPNMWDTRRVNADRSYTLKQTSKCAYDSYTPPLSPLMWALHNDEKPIFTKLFEENPESCIVQISFTHQTTLHSYSLASNADPQDPNSVVQHNTADFITYLEIEQNDKPQHDFSYYIGVTLEHHVYFSPEQLTTLLVTMIKHSAHNQYYKANILKCIDVLKEHISFDKPLPWFRDQAIITIAGAIRDIDILDKLNSVNKTKLDLNYATEHGGVTPLATSIEYYNFDAVEWLVQNGCEILYSKYFKSTYLDAAWNLFKETSPANVSEKYQRMGIFDILLVTYLDINPVPETRVLKDPDLTQYLMSRNPELGREYEVFRNRTHQTNRLT